MPLTDSAIKTAKPKEKPYKLSDAHGLYLEITPNGSKLWRLKYRVAGKEKKLQGPPDRPWLPPLAEDRAQQPGV